MENQMKIILYLVLGGVILSAVLLGLRSTALVSAYDANSATNITDSAGTVHSVAASGISADTVSTLYMLGVGLVWLIVIIGIVLEVVGMLKHK